MAECDPQIAAHMPLDAVKTVFTNPDATLFNMVDVALSTYHDRRALGERAYDLFSGDDVSTRQFSADFRTLTYGALQDRIRSLAT